MPYRAGRHFLQIPGPTNVPDRVLRAMSRPTIDHRGPEFQALAHEVLRGLREVFQTQHPVVIFPASGSGAWEAALVNCLSPGDRILMFESGQFATLWRQMADALGFDVVWIPADWHHGVDPVTVVARLADDHAHTIKAVCVVHNETSTGIVSRIPAVRQAIDQEGHPALLMVDTISSLGSIDYRHDAWAVDVTIGASQKGLMLPPGLSFNALSDKALAAHQHASMPRSFWDWTAMLKANEQGFFPYTPSTNLLYGLQEALAMLREEGLPTVFARHARHAAAAREAVRAWGLDMVAANPEDYSASITAVVTPEGHDADVLRRIVLDRFDLSLGAGLGRLAGSVFRIGHLGDLNDLSLLGTLAGVEMGLSLAGIPHQGRGVEAAMRTLAAPPK
ncbi:MAG: aminotransferase class V-fold PLP-dependent enzyme [Acidobacteria bacterium]|nr:aminotransferase class V-fold PLP-dependent enzyme [Acidobacteriota bacterium]